MDSLSRRQLLNAYYREVSDVIVHKQNPISGLLPASTAVSVHGDYTDAWVRDNVYSILAVWGLSLAYRALDDDDGRGKELEGRTIHLMRGLLRSMMAQAHKVEAFKLSRHPRDALHAKYDTRT
ncbi:MAG TPA: glycoside hydrolase family 15 protein, partial [Polyangiaceae bacterium]|nr:glycoside hydrolase family 15 protein [Polyangiaceae bacterium]